MRSSTPQACNNLFRLKRDSENDKPEFNSIYTCTQNVCFDEHPDTKHKTENT